MSGSLARDTSVSHCKDQRRSSPICYAATRHLSRVLMDLFIPPRNQLPLLDLPVRRNVGSRGDTCDVGPARLIFQQLKPESVVTIVEARLKSAACSEEYTT